MEGEFLKVGDRVKVKSWSEVQKKLFLTPPVLQSFCDQIVIITRIDIFGALICMCERTGVTIPCPLYISIVDKVVDEHKLKVGDTIRVKSWDELSAKYTYDYANDGFFIRPTLLFPFVMRKYCGKEVVIKAFDVYHSEEGLFHCDISESWWMFCDEIVDRVDKIEPLKSMNSEELKLIRVMKKRKVVEDDFINTCPRMYSTYKGPRIGEIRNKNKKKLYESSEVPEELEKEDVFEGGVKVFSPTICPLCGGPTKICE